MHMYVAAIFAVIAMFFYPERNVTIIPFAELTLKLLATTAIFLYLAYCSIKFVFHSFVEDKFWPWRWTKRIALSLASRSAMLAVLAGVIYLVSEHTKWGPMINEYPIISLIIIFIVASWIMFVPDEEIFGKTQSIENNAEPIP